MTADKRVLVVEDRSDIRDTIKKNVERAGYSVDTAATLQEGLERVNRKTYHVALLDVNLSDSQDGEDRAGIEIAASIKELGEGTQCMVISGETSEEVPVDAIEAGVAKYVIKKRIRTPADYVDHLDALYATTELKFFGKYAHLHAYLAWPRKRDDWENSCISFLSGGADQLFRVLENVFSPVLPVIRLKNTSYSLKQDPDAGELNGLFWSKALGCAIWVAIGSKGSKIKGPPEFGHVELLKRKEKGPENFGIWTLPEVPRDKFFESTSRLE